jgi:alkylated DNA nucleotide flippase Atl1
MKIDILREKLFDYLLEIPKGKVITYQKLGDIFEVHPRKI